MIKRCYSDKVIVLIEAGPEIVIFHYVHYTGRKIGPKRYVLRFFNYLLFETST